MPNARLLLAALSSAFVCLLLAPAAFAQGSLTPPGAPAPLFKTLDQIEARKPLGTPNVATTTTIVIDQPGSYVLTGPITVASGDGIAIYTGNVTLDLNGFTISSTASPRAGSGVSVFSNTYREIVVRNGVIAGGGGLNTQTPVPDATGFIHGVALGLPSPQFLSYNSRVEDVRVGAVTGYGIFAETVKNCGVRVGLSAGIYGSYISDSTVYVANPIGIEATVSVRNSSVQYANGTVGIRASHLVDACTVSSLNCVGIRARLVTHSVVSFSGTGAGIEAQSAVGSLMVAATNPTPTGSITFKYDMP